MAGVVYIVTRTQKYVTIVKIVAVSMKICPFFTHPAVIANYRMKIHKIAMSFFVVPPKSHRLIAFAV